MKLPDELYQLLAVDLEAIAPAGAVESFEGAKHSWMTISDCIVDAQLPYVRHGIPFVYHAAGQ